MGDRYDEIGMSYAFTRKPDDRIVERLIALLQLPAGASVADIGAGTGSYSRALADRGYRVRAVEPSEIMRAQAAPHPGVEWFDGYAENIPLASGSVDGIICMLALHHFTDASRAIKEMMRVVSDGPVVIFTYDPRAGEPFWLFEYFPSFYIDAIKVFPPLDKLAAMIVQASLHAVQVESFSLPPDLSDLFCAAAWRRPELYLDPAVQRGISSFAVADTEAVAQGLQELHSDLRNGRWQEKYGSYLEKTVLDAGYRFVVIYT